MTESTLDPRVQVLVRPPSDPQAAGHAELQGIGSGEARPPMDELAGKAWLTQAAAVRGCELETIGLSVYAGHPELQLLNVPTSLAESAIRVLRELGTYVLAGGELEDGDIMQMRADLPYLVGFHAVEGGTTDTDRVLRVVLLA
jgi:hypothetical protein